MRHGGCPGCSHASLGRTLTETTVLRSSATPRAGGLTDQVVALGDIRGPTGGIRVRRGGGPRLGVHRLFAAVTGGLAAARRYFGMVVSWCRGPRLSWPFTW